MDIELKCPHCSEYFIVSTNEINCGIFRHAIYKSNNQPIPPHENKINCDKLVADNLVYGCAKPFQIIKKDNLYVVEICDYI